MSQRSSRASVALEALERAARDDPEHLPEALSEAGHLCHQLGLHHELWKLMSGLPEALRQDERVLFWRLTCAVRLGREHEVREEVEAHLASHEAPELRALYAGTLAPLERSAEEAERAYRAARTPYTAYQYGMRLELVDRDRAVDVLREAVCLAEQVGRPYEQVRNAQGLAVALLGAGRYLDAEAWAAWALERFERHGLRDVQRWLSVVNDWTYARILTGRTAGLGELLEAGERKLSRAYPGLARLYRSTLGDYHLSRGDPERAAAYYRRNWEQAGRREVAASARSLVRALVELGRIGEAVEVGERVYRLCREEFLVHRRNACLAYGMALAARDPEHGIPLLREAYEAYRAPLLAYRLAQAALHLGRACLRVGDRAVAQAALEGARCGLAELAETGLRLLGGPPEEFCEVLALLEPPGAAAVELRLLGRCEARVAGRYVRLEPRQAEILALLALHPQGLTGEELARRIYGNRAGENAVKVTISRLREAVPLASRPYRIALPVRADFQELERLLEQGEVRRAVALYAGPLLPHSEVKEIEEVRWVLEARVRRAVLAARDLEALLLLAERLRDDLELWEAALEALPPADPRRPLVRTRVRRLGGRG